MQVDYFHSSTQEWQCEYLVILCFLFLLLYVLRLFLPLSYLRQFLPVHSTAFVKLSLYFPLGQSPQTESTFTGKLT